MQEEGDKTVPLEVLPEVKHDKRGILSMGRHSDPNSGGSSFSILLGPAPHLDMQYTIFGCAFPTQVCDSCCRISHTCKCNLIKTCPCLLAYR